MDDEPLDRANTSNSNGKCDSDESSLQIHGDTIGDTAYSQRFVLKILMKMSSETTFTEDFLEKDVCLLWNMTTEKDVAEFLLKFKALDIIHSLLNNTNDNRLIEILMGIVANMCCHAEVIGEIKNELSYLIENINFLNCGDSLVIIQVLRFIYSNVYNDSSNLTFWLKSLEENNFFKSIAFIMENSINSNVLKQSLETLNCICSTYSTDGDSDKELFIKLFVTNDIVHSSLTAFNELDQQIEDHSIDDADNERYQIVFLALHSILAQFHNQTSDAYKDETRKLFKIINVIMRRTLESMGDSIPDFMEYTKLIMSAFNFPETDETFDISNNMLQLWVKTCDAEHANDLPDFEQTDVADTNGETLPIFVQFFAEIFKLWPTSKVDLLFRNAQKKYLRILCVNTKLMLKEGCLDYVVRSKSAGYYDDVCPAMIKLIDKE